MKLINWLGIRHPDLAERIDDGRLSRMIFNGFVAITVVGCIFLAGITYCWCFIV